MSRVLRSPALYANAWHHRSDALSSIVVLAGVVGAHYGLPFFDPLAAIIVAMIIAVTGVAILVKTGKELIETSVDSATIDALKNIAESHDLVQSSHQIFARNVGINMAVELHIVVAPKLSVREAHTVANNIEDAIREKFPHAHNILIHIDPYNDENEDLVKENF